MMVYMWVLVGVYALRLVLLSRCAFTFWDIFLPVCSWLGSMLHISCVSSFVLVVSKDSRGYQKLRNQCCLNSKQLFHASGNDVIVGWYPFENKEYDSNLSLKFNPFPQSLGHSRPSENSLINVTKEPNQKDKANSEIPDSM